MAEQEAPQISEGQITEEALERLRSRLGTYNRPSFYGLGPLHEEATRDSIRPPLRRLHGAQAVTTFSQVVRPPRERGTT